MSTTTFTDLIALPDSRKVFLVETEPSQQLTDWTVHAGSIYYQAVGSPMHVLSVAEDGTDLTEVSTLGAVSAGEWYYDGATGRVYVQASSGNVYDKVIVADYKLYFSSNTDGDEKGVIFNDRLYEPLVLSVPSIRQMKTDLFWGISIVSDGQLSLFNHNGYFDKWYNDFAWNNKPILVLLGGEDLPYSEFMEMFTGTIFDKNLGTDLFTISFVDRKYDLSDSLPEDILSASDWPRAETELIGRPIPLVFGTVYRIPALCVTGQDGTATSLHTFKFADTSLGSVQAISQVYVNDVAVSHSSGSLSAGTFKLGTSSFSVGDTVSLDGAGYVSGSTLLENPVDVLKKLLGIKGYTYGSTYFNTASIAAARSDAADFPIGLHVGEFTPLLDLIGDIMKSCLGVMYLDNGGLFSVTIWDTDIPASPDSVDELDIIKGTLRTVAKSDDIRRVVRIGWRKNWAAGTYAYKQDTSDTTQHVYGITRSRTVPTLQSSEAGVDIYLARMKIMLESATTEISFDSKLPLATKNVGDRFEISYKRGEDEDNIGWLDGRMIEVLEIDKDFTTNIIHVVTDDLKGIGGNVGRWVKDNNTFPLSLGGGSMDAWDSSWSATQRAYASSHSGFWCDDNGFADPADASSRQISRWW